MTTITLATILAAAAAMAPVKQPKLPKPQADMECLVGRWKGTGTLVMGDQQAKLDLSLDCKRTPGGFGIACTSRILGIPGMASYEETDLFGYDAGKNKYHWFSVTSGGETHDHVADVPAAGSPKITWVYDGIMEAKPMRETNTFTFTPDGKGFALTSEQVVDGHVVATITGTVKK